MSAIPPAAPAAAPVVEQKPAAAAAAPAPAAPAAAPAAPAAGEAPKAPAKPAAAAKPTLGAIEAEPKAAAPKLGDIEPEDAEPEASADADPAAEEVKEEASIEYKFEAPEGQEYRAPVIDAYTAVLTKHKVDPAIAKDILETMLPVIRQDSDAQVQQHIDATRQEWEAELVNRHGDKRDDVVRLANRALAKAGAPEPLRNFIRDSALAVNPDFVDLLAFFGQRVSNDRPPRVAGTGHDADAGDPTERIARDYDQQAAAAAGKG